MLLIFVKTNCLKKIVKNNLKHSLENLFKKIWKNIKKLKIWKKKLKTD